MEQIQQSFYLEDFIFWVWSHFTPDVPHRFDLMSGAEEKRWFIFLYAGSETLLFLLGSSNSSGCQTKARGRRPRSSEVTSVREPLCARLVVQETRTFTRFRWILWADDETMHRVTSCLSTKKSYSFCVTRKSPGTFYYFFIISASSCRLCCSDLIIETVFFFWLKKREILINNWLLLNLKHDSVLVFDASDKKWVVITGDYSQTVLFDATYDCLNFILITPVNVQ